MEEKLFELLQDSNNRLILAERIIHTINYKDLTPEQQNMVSDWWNYVTRDIRKEND